MAISIRLDCNLAFKLFLLLFKSFKDDINTEINGLSNELKQLLNDDLKLQNEQPQQTTQPE